MKAERDHLIDEMR